jgi:hypothetical protein
MDIEPGLYRHYKGGYYVVIGTAFHHETRAKMVLYASCTKGTLNVRPLHGDPLTKEETPDRCYDPDGFLDTVVNEFGGEVKRFTKVDT